MFAVVCTAPEEALEAAVDKELVAFDEWFQSRGNDPIVRSERAILKTYLWYKCKAEKKDGP